MNTNKRSFLLALAFAVTVSAGLTGLSMSGQSKESPLDEACAHATWPMIPAQCLVGADSNRTVRTVEARAALDRPEAIGQRFALAFN
jgi:hypothetical protein